MHWGMTAWLQLATIVAILAVLHVPLGNYMASVYSGEKHWRAERLIYRIAGVEPDREQHWVWYAASVLAFSVVSVAVLFGLLMLQAQLPAPWGAQGMTPLLALNTAVSFVTNTSWQNYAGESSLGHVGLTVGLGVQAFASSAVGMAVAIALIRGIVRRQTVELGNFWVDLVRGIIRILIPMAVLIAVLLTALGVLETFGAAQSIGTLAGGSQTLPTAPVASWESIKLMSGDGGGAFNANSAHPFENPTPLTNVIEIVTMAVIPVSLVRTYGVMIGDRRQGWALLAVVVVLFGLGTAAVGMSEAMPHGTVTSAVGAALEGKEVRFGIPGSAQFGQVATATADGAANSSYDSFTSVGGGVLMANMMLGEISPGGTGSGLYGLVVIALLAVFLGGLMIGRTPEYLGKRVSAREMKLVSLAVLTPPVAVLTGVAIAMALPAGARAATNSGPHGLSEVLYAFTSCVAGNGSAFGGFSGNTTGFNIGLAVAMIIGRYVPMILVISLAASFAGQRSGVVTDGTLRTHEPSFVGLMIGAALIVVGLEYLPALALGPIAERLS
ncbi:potassium-transporting ATPase subunit KdpA [Mycolicibacterium aubagnense]|uniref:Potassium-transporting ATPase potassium-binding subunit n=2 Tax=Mycolicibacterium aubagnense TaxID=319707 RepID=A0ABN5YUC4_9MYCO|nr:potassium-transporting ATPase subunit KdpA [Mycolicibacterium aubagnense]TLH49649.1 potassium-transporting ATPase subunit KdpA [Mycolicibacterium aubagnense]WGI32931.1 potassium-transporting ATPase subunit KdpA [Mycolicibacterium aubagnense]BBX85392.1 potassium-transporting ATPase potassium-binding subunit [Mycolicibacterium aubagnense]